MNMLVINGAFILGVMALSPSRVLADMGCLGLTILSGFLLGQRGRVMYHMDPEQKVFPMTQGYLVYSDLVGTASACTALVGAFLVMPSLDGWILASSLFVAMMVVPLQHLWLGRGLFRHRIGLVLWESVCRGLIALFFLAMANDYHTAFLGGGVLFPVILIIPLILVVGFLTFEALMRQQEY